MPLKDENEIDRSDIKDNFKRITLETFLPPEKEVWRFIESDKVSHLSE